MLWNNEQAEDEEPLQSTAFWHHRLNILALMAIYLLYIRFCYGFSVFIFCKFLGKTGDLLQGISFSCKSVIDLIGVTEEYTEYVVCPNCNSLYSFSDCLEVRANGQNVVNLLNFTDINNTGLHMEICCWKSQLLGGNVKSIPRKTYPYYSIKQLLSDLISIPGFVD